MHRTIKTALSLALRPATPSAFLFVTTVIGPTAVWAHASDRGFVLLLPTSHYQVGGALAVLLSILLFATLKHASVHLLQRTSLVLPLAKTTLRTSMSWVAFLFLLLLLSTGFIGSPDPLANPLPLSAWTLFWVLFTLMHAVFGNLWSVINPWQAPTQWLAKRLVAWPRIPLPEGLGFTPAIAGLLLFAWYELVSLAPEDPRQLSSVISLYWLFHCAAILTFGYEAWMRRGEPFSVFFRFISLLAPVTRVHSRLNQPIEQASSASPSSRSTKSLASSHAKAGQANLTFSLPGAKLLQEPSPGISGAIFVLISLATVSFDGLNKTFWWLGRHNINPLEFGGRSTVVSINSVGLIQAIGMLGSVYFAAIFLGWLIAGRRVSLGQTLAITALAILPISLAYHFSHYLTQFMVNGQYALKAFSDPYNFGWNLLGMDHFHVTTSFLSHHLAVEIIWKLQVFAIVIGHVLSVALAHLLALRIYALKGEQTRKFAVISQLPLGFVMVAYTLFGLWLLSTATGA